MPITYPDDVELLADELVTMRGIEALYEWLSYVGATYFQDDINSDYDLTDPNQKTAHDASIAGLNQKIVGGIVAQHASRKSDFETFFLATYLAAVGTPLATDISAGPVGYTYDANLLASGEVRISSVDGYLGMLRRDMIANSQTIKSNTVTVGAIAAASANVGALAEYASGPSGRDHTLTGEVVVECVDDTVDAPILSVKLALTTPLIDGTTERVADHNAKVGKYFEDGQTGLYNFQLILGAITESGDGGNMLSAEVVTSPSERDTDKGKLYITVLRMSGTGGNPDFRITWYRSNNRATTDRVAVADITGTAGSVAVTMIGSKTVLAFTFSKTNAAAALPSPGDDDDDIALDIKTPRVGDVWTYSIANNEAGKGATKIGRRWPVSLNSTGVPSISDTLFDSKSMA